MHERDEANENEQAEQLSAKGKLVLQHTFLQLNPVKLRATIDDKLHQLWQLPR